MVLQHSAVSAKLPQIETNLLILKWSALHAAVVPVICRLSISLLTRYDVVHVNDFYKQFTIVETAHIPQT